MNIQQLINELEKLPNYPIMQDSFYARECIDTIETHPDNTVHLLSVEGDAFTRDTILPELKKLDPTHRVIIQHTRRVALSEVTWDSETADADLDEVGVEDERICLNNTTIIDDDEREEE